MYIIIGNWVKAPANIIEVNYRHAWNVFAKLPKRLQLYPSFSAKTETIGVGCKVRIELQTHHEYCTSDGESMGIRH